MEIFTEILKYSLPLLGVVIGWFLSQLGEQFKVLREDKRRIKKTIFYLLEVRHHLAILIDVDKSLRKYISILRKKFPRMFPITVSDDEIVSIISIFLNGVLQGRPLITEDDLKNLNSNYTKSIESLSEIDPILAFRLYGRQNVQPMLKDFAQRMKGSVSQLNNNPNDAAEVDKVFEKISPSVLNELLGDLNEIILSLAKKIDRKTYKESKHRLAFTKETFTKDQELFLEKIVNQFMPTDSSQTFKEDTDT